MQTLQNKFIKVLFNYDRLTNTTQLYSDLQIPNLKKILELEQCKLIFKIINEVHKCNTEYKFTKDIHSYETRTHQNLYQTKVKSQKGLNNPIAQASKIFNQLPTSIKSVSSIGKFSDQIREYLELV